MPAGPALRALAAATGLLLVADVAALATVGRQAGTGTGATMPPPTTAPPPTTTTTAPLAPRPVGTAPLTGLPAYSEAAFTRPALSIKVDNAPDARPQSGLDNADIVTEEIVEGGLTRFFVTYQSEDAAVVGPVRSARPVDSDLLTELGGGIFAFSGAAAGVLQQVRAGSGALILTPDGTDLFHRDPYRPAPANLYVSTAALYARATTERPPPPALFTYGPPPSSSTLPAPTVTLRFSGSSVARWTWGGADHTYVRTQDGRADVLVDGRPVTATDVVILSVETVASGDFDVLGNENPESVVVGSGRCWVLRDGIVVAGTWRRASAADRVHLLDASGNPIELRAGRTWLELLPLPAQPAF